MLMLVASHPYFVTDHADASASIVVMLTLENAVLLLNDGCTVVHSWLIVSMIEPYPPY